MKYNTKYDNILHKKYDDKVWKEGNDSEYFWPDLETKDGYWYSDSASILWGRPSRNNKPVRNLYKEVIKLSRLCMLATQNS